jgi:RNA recognition motif-containing protein
VVVHGLPYSYTWQQLKDLGKTAASVLHADIVSNPDGSSKGWGILAFATPSDAQAAIQVGGCAGDVVLKQGQEQRSLRV